MRRGAPAAVTAAALLAGLACLKLEADGRNPLLPVMGLLVLAAIAAIARRPFDGLLLLLIIVYLRPGDRLESLQKLHPVLAVMLLTGLFAWLQHLLCGRPKFPRHRVNALLAGFLAAGLWATIPRVGTGATLKMLEEGLGSSLLLYFLLATLVADPWRLRRTVWVIVVCGAANAIMAIDAARAGSNKFAGRVAAVGTLADPNDLCLVLVMALPLALALMRGGSRRERTWAAVMTACLLAGILATQSRGGALALAAVLFKEGWDHIPDRRKRRRFAVVAGLLALVGLNLVFLRRGSGLAAVGSDINAVSRRYYWTAGLKMLRDYPLRGVGLYQFPAHSLDYKPPGLDVLALTAHNSYVLVAGELALPGLAFFLPLLVTVWRAAGRVRRRAGLAPPGAAPLYECLQRGFLGWLVAATFLSQAYHSWLYIAIGLIVAADRALAAAELEVTEGQV
jgi:hypothetical protein